eukprot:882304-Pelagomonas_calceolata.AAC.4
MLVYSTDTGGCQAARMREGMQRNSAGRRGTSTALLSERARRTCHSGMGANKASMTAWPD